MQRDGVGLPEQVVELAPTFFTLPAGVVEHAHVEGRGTRRNGSAGPSQADDPKRRPRDVAAEEVRLGPTATPAALTDSTIGDDEPPPDREQQREREIGSRRRQHAGRIRERDSVRRARGRIDRVVADAVVRDDSEVREQVERLAVDPFADNGERQHVVAAPTRSVRERRGQIFDVVELVPGRPGEAARGKRLQDAAILSPLRGGGSSVGRAPGCGPGGRGFESRPPPFPRESGKRLSPRTSAGSTYRTESISSSAGFQIFAFAPAVVFITEKWSALNEGVDLTPTNWICEAGKPASSKRAKINLAPRPSTLVSLSPSMIMSFSFESSFLSGPSFSY